MIAFAFSLGDPITMRPEAEAFADRVLSAVFCGQLVLGYCGADATPEKLASWVAAHRPPQDPRI